MLSSRREKDPMTLSFIADTPVEARGPDANPRLKLTQKKGRKIRNDRVKDIRELKKGIDIRQKERQ